MALNLGDGDGDGKTPITLIGTSQSAARNPRRVLLFGQYAVERDTKLLRIGDGVTPYYRLEPFFLISNANYTSILNRLVNLEIGLTLVGYKIDQTPNTGSSYGLLGGVVDNSNKIFQVSNGAYKAAKLIVIYQNAIHHQGVTYTATNPSSGIFTFTTVTPFTGESVMAIY